MVQAFARCGRRPVLLRECEREWIAGGRGRDLRGLGTGRSHRGRRQRQRSVHQPHLRHPGADPQVGTSLGKTFVAWNTGGPVFVAERAGGAWTGAAVTGVPASVLAIPAQGGRARLVYRSDVDLRMRTQT